MICRGFLAWWAQSQRLVSLLVGEMPASPTEGATQVEAPPLFKRTAPPNNFPAQPVQPFQSCHSPKESRAS